MNIGKSVSMTTYRYRMCHQDNSLPLLLTFAVLFSVQLCPQSPDHGRVNRAAQSSYPLRFTHVQWTRSFTSHPVDCTKISLCLIDSDQGGYLVIKQSLGQYFSALKGQTQVVPKRKKDILLPEKVCLNARLQCVTIQHILLLIILMNHSCHIYMFKYVSIMSNVMQS